MTFTNLDDLLRGLPSPQAPATLLPRVMAAVRTFAQRPWYERAWFTWPPVWRFISAGLALAGLAALVGIAPEVERALRTPLELLRTGWSGEIAAIEGPADAGLTSARVLWRTLLAPVVPYAFALTAVMAAACALFGAALTRVTALEDLTR